MSYIAHSVVVGKPNVYAFSGSLKPTTDSMIIWAGIVNERLGAKERVALSRLIKQQAANDVSLSALGKSFKTVAKDGSSFACAKIDGGDVSWVTEGDAEIVVEGEGRHGVSGEAHTDGGCCVLVSGMKRILGDVLAAFSSAISKKRPHPMTQSFVSNSCAMSSVLAKADEDTGVFAMACKEI